MQELCVCDEGGERVWGWILRTEPPAGYGPLWYCTPNPSGCSKPKAAEWNALFTGLWIKIRTWGVTVVNKPGSESREQGENRSADRWEVGGELQQGPFRHSGAATLTPIPWRSVNFLGSEPGKFQWAFCHFTGETVSFYLTLQFIQQLLQLVDLRAPVLVVLPAHLWKTNTCIKLFHIHLLFRNLPFLSLFGPADIKCFNYSQWQVNKSLTTHATCGGGSRVGAWRYANLIVDPASASPAAPLCGRLLHGCCFSPAEEAINHIDSNCQWDED